MNRVVRELTLPVSETNLRKTALRVLNGQRLVSTEVAFIVRTLGAKATQQVLDDTVLQVRKMPWTSIVLPE